MPFKLPLRFGRENLLSELILVILLMMFSQSFAGNMCSNCTSNCEEATGLCMGECATNYYGQKCEYQCKNCKGGCEKNAGICFDCWQGDYGDYCNVSCSIGCSGDGHDCIICADKGATPLRSQYCSCKQTECLQLKYNCSKCKDPSWYITPAECCPCQERHCAEETGNQSFCGTEITDNGKCSGECQPGYYGQYCSLICNPHCGGIHHLCDKETGYCLKGCEEGWYGSTCNTHCKYHFPHCTRCGTYEVFGRTEIKCVDCEKGYYTDIFLVTRCEKCKNCENNACLAFSGACLEGCKKGFYYDFYKQCSLSCEHCLGDGCHKNGTCLVPGCKPGYHSDRCHAKCPYNCLLDECDALTGECLRGCKQGFFGKKCQRRCRHCRDDYCDWTTGNCFECKPAFWGDGCNSSCTGCIDEVCTHPEGCRYGCKPGLHSEFCNLKCPDQCSTCDQFTGTCRTCDGHNISICIDRNRSPRILSPKDASSNGSCASGMYGRKCNISCPLGCAKNKNQIPICDRFTGTCLFIGCVPGLYGMYCEKNCSLCDQTKSNNRPSCDRLTGKCNSCSDGRYGAFCEENCIDSCPDHVCLQNSGSCLKGCEKGWSGDHCEVQMEMSGDSPIKQIILAVIIPLVAIAAIAIVICCKFRMKRTRYVPAGKENVI